MNTAITCPDCGALITTAAGHLCKDGRVKPFSELIVPIVTHKTALEEILALCTNNESSIELVGKIEKIADDALIAGASSQKEEIERLKGLIEKAFSEGHFLGGAGYYQEQDWQKFKMENKL